MMVTGGFESRKHNTVFGNLGVVYFQGMNADSQRHGAVFRGKLLEISSLLTHLQSHLVPEGLSHVLTLGDDEGESFLVVTPQDLQDAIDYRELLEEGEETQNNLAIVEGFGVSTQQLKSLRQVLSDYINKDLEHHQVRLKECTKRTKKVHFMWNRLTVWWTKFMAQQLLLTKTEELVDESTRSASQECCSSPLLNLPGSGHFRAVIPEIDTECKASLNGPASGFHQNKLDCCSLPLPPNKHTWKEFARLCQMVLLLENQSGGGRGRKGRSALEQALTSPCCIHDSLPHRAKHIQQGLSKDFEFTAPNLSALWIRAQRNTQGMRHMWMIFELYPKIMSSPEPLIQPTGSTRPPVETGAETHQGDDRSNRRIEQKLPRSFTAVLKGNPTHSRSRVTEMSRRVDQLVEWAVTNQVLYTHKHILNYLIMTPMFQRKRKIYPFKDRERLNRKRSRRDPSSEEVDVWDLKMACLSFLVRWFARRNRFVASFLYSASIENHHLDPASMRSDQLALARIFADVVKNVHVLLKEAEAKKNSHVCAMDRYFARLDERLFLKGAYDLDDTAVREQVIAMLDALQKSATWNASQHAQIERAKQDFDTMYDHFFGDEYRDAYDIASELITKETNSQQEMVQLLTSLPSPWPRSCTTCKSSTGNLVACVNCEKVYHSENCSPGHAKLSLPEVIASNASLKLLCRLRLPDDNGMVPDYTNQDSLNWTDFTIAIERTVRSDGSVTPLGLGLRTVEDCDAAFEKLRSESATVVDLIELMSNSRKAPYPMKGIQGGYLVVETKDGDACGKPAGIQTGDILIAVEHLEIVDPKEAAEFPPSKVINMAELPSETRLNLLKVASTKLKIHLRRPNRNIVQESRAWYSRVRGLNKTFSTFLRDDPISFWVCADCVSSDSSAEGSDTSDHHIVQEARRCQAVIHKVGLESFALPFIDDDILNIQRELHGGQVKEGRFFSLRRLDTMMTAIIAMRSSKSDNGAAFSTAFTLPPWALSNKPTRRLEWATEALETQPIHLICKALVAWLEVEEPDDKRHASRNKTIRYFLYLLSSWCVLPCRASRTTVKTKGPLEGALYMREPWLCKTCVVCCGQPIDGDSMTCRNAQCSNLKRSQAIDVEYVKEDNAPKVVSDIVSYNNCSSLVGKTFLVLPDDPLVTALKAHIQVEHCGRPVEFLIASYLPAPFDSEAFRSKPNDDLFDKLSENEGVFHLVPLVSNMQLLFLLERSKIRKKQSAANDLDDISWISLDMLDLPGVARYSLAQLERKLLESEAMRRSIDKFITNANGADDIVDVSLPQLMLPSGIPQALRDSKRQQELFTTLSQCDVMSWNDVLPPSIRGMFSRPSSSQVDEATWETEFGDIGVQESQPVSKSTNAALDIVRPTETSLELLYSDLHFSTPAESSSLAQALVPQVLLQPKSYTYFKRNIKTILLQRSKSSLSPDSYRGIGFGFEVVRWQGERSPRLGRIHKHSPAFAAGLESGDILLTADGRDMADMKDPAQMATLLLGSSLRIRLDPHHGDFLNSILSTVKESRTPLNSVVLTICRIEEEMAPLVPTARRPMTGNVAAPGMHGTSNLRTSARPKVVGAHGTAKDPIDLVDDHEPSVATQHENAVQNAVISPNNNLHRQDAMGLDHDDFEPIPVVTGPVNRPVGVPNARSTKVPTMTAPSRTGNEMNLNLAPSQKNSATAAHPQHRVSMKTLFDHVLAASARRVSAGFGHLYRPAEGGTIFTLMECAVFLECLQNFMPKLGIRLLCPRYNFAVIADQVNILATWSEQQVEQVPRISASIYSYILNMDYKRATNPLKPEGPIKFREGPHTYREPVDILPIDRQVEKALNAERRVQESQRLELEAHFDDSVRAAAAHHRQAQFNHSHFDFLDHDHTPAPMPPAKGYNNHHAYQQFSVSQYQANRGWPQGMAHNPSPPTNTTGYADLSIHLDDNSGQHHIHGDRIRGGGPLSTETESGDQCVDLKQQSHNERCLAEVPVYEWNHLPVYLFVETDEFSGDETLMVGWITNFQASAAVDLPEIVHVEAHYLASMGYFAAPQSHSFYPEDIFVVDENLNTEAATVIRKLRAQGSAPKPTEAPPSKYPGSLPYNSCLDEGMQVVGRLPDGRVVVWMPYDSTGLYISKLIVEQPLQMALLEFTSMIGRNSQSLSMSCPRLARSDDEICCPWGCSRDLDSNAKIRSTLSFPSMNDLRAHLEQCHSYGSEAEAMEIDWAESLLRVSEGQQILDLCTDIAGAIVANLPSFWQQAGKKSLSTKELSSGIVFKKSPTGDKLSLRWSDSLLRSTLSDRVRQCPSNSLRAMADLWLGMGKLFDIDGSGLFLLKHGDIEAAVVQEADLSSKTYHFVSNTCESTSDSRVHKPKRFLDCALCSLPWEKCVGTTVHGGSPQDEIGVVETRGLGCMLRSDVSFVKTTKIDESSMYGAFGDAKVLLLRVADFIKGSFALQSRKAVDDKSDPLQGCRLWDDTNFEIWTAFVRNCSTPSMFLQALTVLLGSIDRSKMPRWWKLEDGGWSTSQMVMANTSMESFFLHLYVFDLALSETIGAALGDETVEAPPTTTNAKRRVSPSIQLRMQRYMALADELEFQRYHGVHNTECMTCDDGGSLLCCELCSNVQHAKCCEPPLDDEEMKECDWVCDSCINDICHKKGIARDD